MLLASPTIHIVLSYKNIRNKENPTLDTGFVCVRLIDVIYKNIV